MEFFKIDGTVFERMVLNGLNCIRTSEMAVNDMNVFPVPDGDTGTNMRLTLQNALSKAQPSKHLGEYLSSLSSGMLLGARGNSGVILSQIFRGIFKALENVAEADGNMLIDAFVSGSREAYKAVKNPVEGTILTVVREGAESLVKYPAGSVNDLWCAYVRAMKKSLEKTPSLLPVLRDAGVEDSGAFGYIVIADGMYRYLEGEETLSGFSVQSGIQDVDFSTFTENSSFEFGYCMEFLLRLMNSRKEVSLFDERVFTSELERLGESVCVVRDGTAVKVHIHVFSPSPVIELAQRYGEFLSFKLENMCVQHNGRVVKSEKKKRKIHTDLAVITTVKGDGLEDLFSGFDYVYCIKSQSQTVSAEEFIDAVSCVDAQHILIMPDSKNNQASALQAVNLMKRPEVEVFPSDNCAACYYALAMDMVSDSVASRITEMKRNAQSVVCINIARSEKTCISDGVQCICGQYVALLNGKITASSDDVLQTLSSGLEKVSGLKDRESCFVFTGSAFNGDCDSLREMLEAKIPYSEVQIVPGGQSDSYLIAGIV